MKKKLFDISVLILILAASCSKSNNNNSTTPVYGTYSSMDTIYQMLNLQPKYVTLNAVTGGTFYGNSGTRYIFRPNSFQDASGASVTGNVQIGVTEYLKKGDMIFSGMLPINGSNQLISGGEIATTATQNGLPVYLKPGYTFQANVPRNGDTIQGMLFFAGTQGPNQTTNKVNWQQPLDSFGSSTVVVSGDTVSIFSDSMRECNADCLGLSNWNPQNFNVTLSVIGATLSSSTVVEGFTLFDGYKSEWPLGITGSYSNGVFNEVHVPTIAVHFVAFTLINGKFYGGVAAASPVTGKNYLVNLTEVDPTSFKEQLNTLYN
jgi:hypothetical protein